MSFPGVNEQDVILDRPFEREVGGVRNVAAGGEIVTGAGDESGRFSRNRELGNRSESDAAPVIVVPAPGRDAVEVADVLGLRQGQKLAPGQREWIFDEASDFELPSLRGHSRLLAEVQYRPVLDFVLADRKLRHPVAIRRTAA